MDKKEHPIIIKTTENLIKELQDIINIESARAFKQRVENKEFIKQLNLELASKKLNPFLGTALLDGTRTVEDASEMELMALTKIAYKYLRDDKGEKYKTIDFNFWFESEDKYKYDMFSSSITENLLQIKLDLIQRVDSKNYVGRISFAQIADFMKNNLMRYNIICQRAYKTKSIGTKGLSLRSIDLKKENVKEIEKLILKNKLEETQMILNIRLPEDDEDFEPDIKFVPLNEKELNNIGKLLIRPDYNIESKTFTTAEILDGYHRIKGICQAVEKYRLEHNSKSPDGGLDIRIVCRTLTEGRNFISQIFKRSDTNFDSIKGYEQNEVTNFLDSIIKNSEVLRDNVSVNYEDYTIENKLTYKSVLIDVIKEFMNVPLDSLGKSNKMARGIAEKIDEMIFDISVKYFDDNLNKMKNNSNLLGANMFIGYFAIAEELFMCNRYNIDKITDNLYSLSEDVFKKININNKITNRKVVFDFFKNFIIGVVNIA
ncbi:hypothetical protein DWV13_16455 [Clostridium botulinum]|uniref:hypothetical protein n=1 Tax=Clostridium TaxID=1485 RepID=UPI0007741CE2|nr:MULTISPECIES: hypothetical protein [Clostridium]MCS6133185.1 hypothetical protein [Clostridium botulinum]NFL46265.1 hypothetical protein [Clostridium botulinum]NFL90300.1 hypothetical protein [Clostridium botulinum]NFO12530.1 hypothetical protein [Clostridium botulinum]